MIWRDIRIQRRELLKTAGTMFIDVQEV